MKHSDTHGRLWNVVLSLSLIAFSSWHPLGMNIPALYQEDHATETATPTYTNTPSPSPTVFPSNTLTPTLVLTQTPTLTQAFTAEPTFTNPPPTVEIVGDFVPDEILIRFRRNVSKREIETCLQMANAYIKGKIDELLTFHAQVPEGKLSEAIAVVSACPGVRYVEPNYRVSAADTIPSDPDFNLQYGLINIRAPQGWDLSTGSASVTIAILDSGVDFNHLDLASKLVPGYDFVNNDSNPQDDYGHGTHVAGIAAAASNNGMGIAGVSWGARIMPIKVLNASGGGTFANVAAGIIWATDQGAQVINLSLGGNNPSQVLQDAINYADSRGVVLVAAAGNSGSNFVLYPARYPQVIAVGATDASNAHAGFSNYGPELDLSAPGDFIYSTMIGGYGYSSGTSMAAPFVSGLAAILRGIPGNSSPSAIAFQMESTALDLGPAGVDEFHGHGLIQMDAAIGAVLQVPTETLTLTSTVLPISPTLQTPTFTHIPSSTATVISPSNPGGPLPSSVPPVGSIPTATVVMPQPSSELATMSPTLTLTAISPVLGTESAEVFALETPTPKPTQEVQDWIIPCLGVVFILLGIFLFWMSRSNSKMFGRIKRFK